MKQFLILLLTCAAMEGKGQDTAHMKNDTLKSAWTTGGCNGCLTGKLGEVDNTDIKFYKTIPDSEAKKYIFMQGPPTKKYDTVKLQMHCDSAIHRYESWQTNDPRYEGCLGRFNEALNVALKLCVKRWIVEDRNNQDGDSGYYVLLFKKGTKLSKSIIVWHVK